MKKLSRFINKAKDMPFKLLVRRIGKRVYSTIYHQLRYVKVSRFPIKMDDNDFIDWESDIIFFFDIKRKDYYTNFLKEKGEVDNIIRVANKICDHTFDLLGSGEVNLGKEIKWNRDFKSGFVWENNYYKKIRTVDLSNDSDVKVPWELSRFQHVPMLGQAYLLTGDEKYAIEFKNQIQSWIKNNPVEMSVNWSNAMEVAIRACNWIVGINYFKNSSIEKDFWKEINQWLYMHGNFIFNNLEKGEINNNHYISDLVGLIWLGLFFKNWNDKNNNAQRWLEFGMSELEIETNIQVYDDGFDYESSTSYHGLVTELLLYTAILCKHNGYSFSREFNNKLEKMCEVIMYITKPNGLIPLIGDMDSGRFIFFTGYGNREMRDFRYLLGVAAEYFDREDFRFYSSNQRAAIWLFKTLKKPPLSHKPLQSKFFTEAGIYVYRKDGLYLIIRCGKHGTSGKGGHTHNDQLSFELNVDGEDFLIDPGTYVYTSNIKARYYFRSTSSHNTLQFENQEQNDFAESEAFRLKEQTNAKVTRYNNNELVGKHFGFKNNNKTITHERKFTITSSGVDISDGLTGEFNNNKFFINFILNPHITISKQKNKLILKGNKTHIALTVPNNLNYTISDTYYSKRYGIKEKTKKVSIYGRVNSSQNFSIRLKIINR